MEKNTNVVVIGAGYAGILATVRLAGRLRRARQASTQITLVNVSDMFVERVRLHEFAANGRIRQRPIAAILRGTNVSFVRGYVRTLDPQKHTLAVETAGGLQYMRYDILLYALGSLTGRESVLGVSDYAYTLAPEGPLSAQALRERLPSLTTGDSVVVCGGGATGIEAAAEFAGNYPHLHVELVTRGSFGEFLGSEVASYMRQSLERLGVNIREQTTVTRVDPLQVETNKGPVPCDLCLWTGGFVAPALARDSGLAVNERGQVLIDPAMRSISHPDILAAGDAAYPVEEPGTRVRMSAFTALVMGAHAADCLSNLLQGREPKPLSFGYLGQGIALGPGNGIGFGLYADDTPHAPYFKGRTGYEIRNFFVRFLAAIPRTEWRFPGVFYWTGRGRYAAARRIQQPEPGRS